MLAKKYRMQQPTEYKAHSNSPEPLTGSGFYIAQNQGDQEISQKRKEFFNMKQGKTLEALGAELQRQRNARKDFVADTRQLTFSTENGKSRLTFSTGKNLLDFGVNHLAHQQLFPKGTSFASRHGWAFLSNIIRGCRWKHRPSWMRM